MTLPPSQPLTRLLLQWAFLFAFSGASGCARSGFEAPSVEAPAADQDAVRDGGDLLGDPTGDNAATPGDPTAGDAASTGDPTAGDPSSPGDPPAGDAASPGDSTAGDAVSPGDSTAGDADSPGDEAALAPAVLTVLDPISGIIGVALPDETLRVTVTLENTGEMSASAIGELAALDMPIRYVDGSFPGTGGSCNQTVDGGGRCWVALEFSASTPGDYGTQLQLSYDDGANATPVTLSFGIIAVVAGGSSSSTLFVTSTTLSGQLNRPLLPDRHCQSVANRGRLAGEFRAVISTSGISADGLEPWVIYPVLDTLGRSLETTTLWHGGPLDGDILTELGNASPGPVWTGSTAIGQLARTNCNDWTARSSATRGVAALEPGSNPEWLGNDGLGQLCNNFNSLYCLQTGRFAQ